MTIQPSPSATPPACLSTMTSSFGEVSFFRGQNGTDALEADIVTISSEAYATPGTPSRRPPQPHGHVFLRNSSTCQCKQPIRRRSFRNSFRNVLARVRTSFVYSHSSGSVYTRPSSCLQKDSGSRLYREQLQELQRKLLRRNQTFGKILTFAVVLLLTSLVLLLWRHPQVLRQAAQHLSNLLTPSTGAGEYEVVTTKLFPEEYYRRCYVGQSVQNSTGSGAGGKGQCAINMETALCLIMAIKLDLDERTRSLDATVDELKGFTDALLQNLTKGTNHISALYSRRPDIYLSLYYSAEAGITKDGMQPLLWRSSVPGLAFSRQVDTLPPQSGSGVSESEMGIIFQGFRVTHPGFYYVYSQVSFQDGSASPGHRYVHEVRLNVPNNNNSRLILKSWSMTGKSASFLNGIFYLDLEYTVTVHSEYSTLDKVDLKNTFFGAFLV